MEVKSYAQIDENGTVCAVSQLLESAGGDHLIELETYAPELIGKRWDAQTRQFVAAQAPDAPADRRISVLWFRRRFTRAERVAVEWAAVDRSEQTEAQRRQAAELRASLADQSAATFIDLDDPDTISGIQALVSIELLTPQRASDILDTAVKPEERP